MIPKPVAMYPISRHRQQQPQQFQSGVHLSRLLIIIYNTELDGRAWVKEGKIDIDDAY